MSRSSYLKIHMMNTETGNAICGRHRFCTNDKTHAHFIIRGDGFVSHFRKHHQECCKKCVTRYDKIFHKPLPKIKGSTK